MQNLTQELERIKKISLQQHKKSMGKSTIQETSTFKCEKCKDSGVILIDDSTAKQCECLLEKVKRNRVNKMLEFASIPKQFRDLKVAEFRTDIYKDPESRSRAEMVRTTVVEYINNFKTMEEAGKGLYMYSGTAGSGKSRMAMSIGNALVKHYGKSVKYMTLLDLLEEMKVTFDSKEKTARDIELAVREVDVLILDDVGVESNKPWSETVVFEIINDRSINKKITIFTSNLSIDNLAYNYRIKSRINGMVVQIQFPEESVRDQLAEIENKKVMDILFGS